jgi:autotransporter strand-loop-strand O-heptosyltransferase
MDTPIEVKNNVGTHAKPNDPKRFEIQNATIIALKTFKGNEVRISFFDGAKLEVIGDKFAKYHVTFLDAITNSIIYQVDLDKNTPNVYWCQSTIKYFINWKILLTEDDIPVIDYYFNPNKQKVFIQFCSNALGDTLAWIPYVEEFRKKHQCDVNVATFHNEIFEKVYPNLKFYTPGSNISGCYALYMIGVFDNDYSKNKNNWRTIPLQQVASDYLGLDYKEIKPKICRPTNPRPIPEKYVAIAEFSTFDCKEWLHTGGWQKIVNYLTDQGYKVVSVSKEPSKLQNIIKFNNRDLLETIHNIQHADFFIGISSGCSWLAWGLDVPTIIISGPTAPFVEMKDCYRVINLNVCNSCMSDKDASFDRGNRRLCPRNKNLECSTAITPEMVISAFERAVSDKKLNITPVNKIGKEKILFITPHMSTGGLPQYLYGCVKDLRYSGCDVVVVEWQDIAPIFDVQKRKIKKICQFYSLDGDRHKQLQNIIQDFEPNIIHIEEFPEYFMPDETIRMIYNSQRQYKILETSHGACVVPPQQKRYLPDRFVFVSPWHVKMYEHLGVPISIAEYKTEPHIRPPREAALGKLGLDPGRYHVLNDGLFTPGKNQGELFEIARQLPDIQFHFVGNQAPNFKDYWEPLMKNKPENCVIWGERHDTENFYAACDLFYFSSKFELFPIVIKEALSWNMPIMMRNLETYCGSYVAGENITFIENNIGNMVEKIRYMFPSLGDSLLTSYYSTPEPKPNKLVDIQPINLPSVAVVIPNYNYGKTLERAILSAQAQTIKPKAIIVVDGGSTDNSKEIVNRLGVTWVENPDVNQGPAKNRGIAAAPPECEFIVPLDSDDWIEPDYIAQCLGKMKDDVAVVTPGLVFNDGTLAYGDAPFTVERLLNRNRLFSCSMLRRLVVEQLGGYCEAASFNCVNGTYEDWDLWLRVVEAGWKIESVNLPLFHFTSRGPLDRDTRYSLEQEATWIARIKLRHEQRMKDFNDKINVIVFSKDRPAQLDALLESIKQNSKGIQNLSVICKYSNEEFFKGYYLVATSHPKANFINQSETKSLKPLLLQALDPSKPYTMMLVDDDIFYRQMPFIPELENNSTYSVRLGKNCTYCYAQNKAQNEGELDFNYSLSLDGNIYRTEDILPRIQSIEFNTPNQLEDKLSQTPPIKLLYANHSCLVGIPNNIVQHEYENRSENGDVEKLNKFFLSGWRININAMDFTSVRGVHQPILYKFQPAETMDKSYIKQLLHSYKNPIVVELGAYNGSDTKWIYDACVCTPKYFAVEPDPRHIFQLICNVPQARIIQTAIADYTGEIDFNLSNSDDGINDHSSSILKPKEHLKMHPQVKFDKTIKVPCMTLDDLVKKENIDHINLLFVDIQGAEKNLIEGGKEILKKTDWIFIESYENEMYEGQILRSELLKMLPDFEKVGEFTDSNILLQRKR